MGYDIQLLSAQEYPSQLREIPRAPRSLHIRGTLPSNDHKWIAIVGSRSCTPYGRQACRELLEGLRGHPVVVVSGLAFGIDAEVHRAALDVGIPTVAIPGSGLNWDVLYPRAHVNLARDILAAGGALISEFEDTQKATDWSFPQRNRIMAGIAHAVLIVEAREKSGSLITAKLTAEFNRELLVVPGSIFSPESVGTHQFLKLGAVPATSSADLLSALGISHEGPLLEPLIEMNDTEKTIWRLLSEPVARDELLRDLNMPTAEVQIALSIMEIKGLIKEELGYVRRT